MILFSGEIYIGYSQFIVFDSDVKRAGCAWTERHSAQGFARRAQVVAFGTLVDYGHADAVIKLGPYRPLDNHERVIEVPFLVTSGAIHLGGPEEIGRMPLVKVENGDYRVVAAQALDEDRELIELFFEKVAAGLPNSRILFADAGLQPTEPLLETVDEA